MKIGFDAKRAFNNQTGLGNYSRLVISGMLKTFPEHEYYLFTPAVKPEFNALFQHMENVHVVTPRSALARRFKALWRTFSVAGLCNALQLDVYHGLSNELPAGMASFTGKKIVTIHDLIFLRYPQYYKRIDRMIYTRKFRNACHTADVVVAASEQTRSDLISFLRVDPEKIRVIYQGCEEQFKRVLSTQEKTAVRNKYNLPETFVVSVGTIEARKDQLTILKAYHKANLVAHLVFVGRQTTYASVLHEYIRDHQLRDRVHFIEGAAFSDFPAFYQLAEAAVYASEFEGFGIPVLEGLASRTRMLVAHTSSLPEVGGTAVDYFEPGDAGQLTTLLTQLLTRPFREDIAEKQLARFEPVHLTRQLFSLYRS